MLSLYREDREKQGKGSPCYLYDMTFYVARLGTKESQKQIDDIKKELYGLFPKDKDINQYEIWANWLAEHGVLGWENVIEDEGGEELEFNRANCRRIFLNQEYWLSLVVALVNHASNYEHYLHDQAYEVAEELKKH